MLHSHCEGCFVRHCTVKPDQVSSCQMILCEQGCGAKFHQCLQSEHSLLCPDERVVCINIQNGCPLMMARRKLGAHLKVCPASVLCCPIEWNRWPMYSVEDKKKMPLPSNISKVNCGQLDVALAMRDQRMLVESLNAPKKIRRILRNRLTTRYPAAPFTHRSSSMESDMFPSEETSRNVSDDESGNTPWNLGNYPPGLQRSVCSRLIHATKQTAETLSATLDIASNHMSTSVTSVSSLESISEDKHETKNAKVSEFTENGPLLCDSEFGSKDTETVPNEDTNISNNATDDSNNNLNSETKLCDILGVDINIDCITKYQPKPAEMFTFLCAQEFRRDEYAWHFKNVHNDIQSCLNGWMEQRCPLAYLGCTFSFRRFQPKERFSIIHSSLLESYGLLETAELSSDTYFNVPKSPTMLSPRQERIDCTQNSIVNDNDFDYNHTPTITKSDVTQNHTTNSIFNSELTHAKDLEVFTSYRAYSPIHVQYSNSNTKENPGCIESGLELLSLPFEVLQQVARLLDSFSLCNLSLTCKLLRDVGCSLLDERGIVIQVWEKVRDADQKVRWRSFCNRWRFSTAFSPVKQWQFNGNNPIGDHLKRCSFNQDKILRDSPFFVYPPGDAPMNRELRSLLAERQRESVSVKLRELHEWYQKFQENRIEDNDDDEDLNEEDVNFFDDDL